VWPLDQRGDRQKLKTHMLACENPRNFVCDVCGQGYNTKRHLKAHMQLHTDEGQKRREMTQAKLMAHGEVRRKNPRRFPCTMCDRNYTTNQKLRFHMTSAHGIGEKLECPLCPKKLMTPNNLSGHLKTVHARESVTNKCFICFKEHPTKVKAIACEVAHRKNPGFEIFNDANRLNNLLNQLPINANQLAVGSNPLAINANQLPMNTSATMASSLPNPADFTYPTINPETGEIESLQISELS